MTRLKLTRRGEIVRDVLQGILVVLFIVAVVFVGGFIDGL